MQPHTTPAIPFWVRGLTAGGRPLVLGTALLMCAPGEYHLARAAGWTPTWAYGMPVVLSAYAGIASAVASVRRRGDRGRWSAIIGAGIALGLAMAAQVVSHLIATGMMTPRHAVLIASVSLVPPAVVGHLLHLAATPVAHRQQDAPDVTTAATAGQDAAASRRPAALAVPRPPVVPAGVRLLPIARREQDAEDTEDTDGVRAPVGASGQRLLSTREVADRAGVDPSTVRNWVRAGSLIPARKDDRGHNWFDASSAPRPITASGGR